MRVRARRSEESHADLNSLGVCKLGEPLPCPQSFANLHVSRRLDAPCLAPSPSAITQQATVYVSRFTTSWYKRL
jgi:hypothetical protein